MSGKRVDLPINQMPPIEYLKAAFLNDLSARIRKEIDDLISQCEKELLRVRDTQQSVTNLLEFYEYKDLLENSHQLTPQQQAIKIQCSVVRGFIRSLPNSKPLISRYEAIVEKLAKTMGFNNFASRATAKEALAFLHQKRLSENLITNRFTYHILVEKKDITGAQVRELFAIMEQDGIEPDAFIYAHLISKSDITSDQTKAFFEEMKAKGIPRTRVFYKLLLQKKEISRNDAFIFFGQMRKDNFNVNFTVYHAFLSRGDISVKDALLIYNIMKTSQNTYINPNLDTYGLLIRHPQMTYQNIRFLLLEIKRRKRDPDSRINQALIDRGDFPLEKINFLLQEIFGV